MQLLGSELDLARNEVNYSRELAEAEAVRIAGYLFIYLDDQKLREIFLANFRLIFFLNV